jgi:hypothetical protein
MGATVTNGSLTPETLKPFLEDCGYRLPLLVSDYRFGTADGMQEVPLAAFAHQPTDVRSVCAAAVSAPGDPEAAVIALRELGAPVVFVCCEEQLQWWRQGTEEPQHLKTLTPSDLPGFFREHQRDFAPDVIYRAKTRGRFVSGEQLAFVDAGLMPLVEGEIGQALSGLVERVVSDLINRLKPPKVTAKFGQWLFQSVFWLLAAKILRDKDVPAFRGLDLADSDQVFARVARHYGGSLSPRGRRSQEREALAAAAAALARFSHLGHVTAESLAYVYENTLVSQELRAELGVHRTPSYLVDYMLWQLAPWIEDIPAADRQVFEPACGHAAFLVSAMRLLKESFAVPAGQQPAGDYLRKRLHGIEVDAFAAELARLTMTLADIPHPDDWDIRQIDMFVGTTLEELARQSTILLANPPFANFTKKDRERYARQDVTFTYVNKATEILHRTLPYLRPGAVFGVVVPQGFLHSRNASSLRSVIANEFEIAEICLFPDQVFTFSDMESAIVLGRRTPGGRVEKHHVRYRRVREPDMGRFRETYTASIDRRIQQARFRTDPEASMRLPELEEVWEWCRSLPRFSQFAGIGQGLTYKGADNLPVGAQTIASDPFPGAVRGFAHLTPELRIDGLPREVWMSLEPTLISRPRSGTTTRIPQILLNYAPVRPSPWRLKAVIDRDGHAVTSRFLTIRPRVEGATLEFFWALCNSPLANAYVYTHAGKRDILVGVMRAMPVPALSHDGIQRVTEAVRAYFEAVTPPTAGMLTATIDEHEARDRLLRVDAEILRLYELPPRLERQVLDLFAGWRRRGVPFAFERYFPADFEPCFPLYMYLSESYQHSTAGALRARYRPVTEPAILAALERAMQDFEE